MKYNDAKALVLAMFGSRRLSVSGSFKMNSPEVQAAYDRAFGQYPPKFDNDDGNVYFSVRLKRIAEALDNRCVACGGEGIIPTTCQTCAMCKGKGWVKNEPIAEIVKIPLVQQIKSILKEFGIEDSDSYVQATITLDYADSTVGVSITKRLA